MLPAVIVFPPLDQTILEAPSNVTTGRDQRDATGLFESLQTASYREEGYAVQMIRRLAIGRFGFRSCDDVLKDESPSTTSLGVQGTRRKQASVAEEKIVGLAGRHLGSRIHENIVSKMFYLAR